MKEKNHSYNIATLFSGAGGLDSGFTKTGKFENQIANDLLQAPADTYSQPAPTPPVSAPEEEEISIEDIPF